MRSNWIRFLAGVLVSVALVGAFAVTGGMKGGRSTDGLLYQASGLHPDGLGQEGDSAPLGQAAAHGHGYLPRAQRSGLGQLPGVAVVEWVVFSDDTGKSHREPQTL